MDGRTDRIAMAYTRYSIYAVVCKKWKYIDIKGGLSHGHREHAQKLVKFGHVVFTRNSIYAIARICHGNSVCLSVTRVDQSKTVEARIMQFSPYKSL